jgi:pyruvate, orthophosphate dikinase
MAKAVAKAKKTAAKSKPSVAVKAKAAPPTAARKALKKSPAKPAPKTAAKTIAKTTVKPVASQGAADAAKSGKWVFTFGDGKAEGKAGLRDLLGGKGANLAEMANLGLPVPPGFTIPTSVCTYFYANDKT